jgi:hypothetical protein
MILIPGRFVKSISAVLKKHFFILSHFSIKLINYLHISNSHYVILVIQRKEESIGNFGVYFLRVIQLCDWGIVRQTSHSQKPLIKTDSDFETMFASHFNSCFHWTAFYEVCCSVIIRHIIVAHVLPKSWILVFSIIFHKSKAEIIITSSWFLF